MSELEPSDAVERLRDLELDTEPTRRMLGSLGLYDASQDEYVNPTHTDSLWADWAQPRPKPEWPKFHEKDEA